MDPSHDGHFCTGAIPTGLHDLPGLRSRGCHLLGRRDNSHRLRQSSPKLYRNYGTNNLLAHHATLVPSNNHRPAVARESIVFHAMDHSGLHNHLPTSTHSMPRCHRDRSHGRREILLDSFRHLSIQNEILGKQLRWNRVSRLKNSKAESQVTCLLERINRRGAFFMLRCP